MSRADARQGQGADLGPALDVASLLVEQYEETPEPGRKETRAAGPADVAVRIDGESGTTTFVSETLENAVAAARDSFGPAVTIASAKRVLQGWSGLLGKARFEVTVAAVPSSAKKSSVKALKRKKDVPTAAGSSGAERGRAGGRAGDKPEAVAPAAPAAPSTVVVAEALAAIGSTKVEEAVAAEQSGAGAPLPPRAAADSGARPSEFAAALAAADEIVSSVSDIELVVPDSGGEADAGDVPSETAVGCEDVLEVVDGDGGADGDSAGADLDEESGVVKTDTVPVTDMSAIPVAVDKDASPTAAVGEVDGLSGRDEAATDETLADEGATDETAADEIAADETAFPATGGSSEGSSDDPHAVAVASIVGQDVEGSFDPAAAVLRLASGDTLGRPATDEPAGSQAEHDAQLGAELEAELDADVDALDQAGPDAEGAVTDQTQLDDEITVADRVEADVEVADPTEVADDSEVAVQIDSSAIDADPALVPVAEEDSEDVWGDGSQPELADEPAEAPALDSEQHSLSSAADVALAAATTAEAVEGSAACGTADSSPEDEATVSSDAAPTETATGDSCPNPAVPDGPVTEAQADQNNQEETFNMSSAPVMDSDAISTAVAAVSKGGSTAAAPAQTLPRSASPVARVGEPQWNRETLSELGVPAQIIEKLPLTDPTDDLEWTAAVGRAIAAVIPAPASEASADAIAVVNAYSYDGVFAILRAGVVGCTPGSITLDGRTSPASSAELTLAIRSLLAR